MKHLSPLFAAALAAGVAAQDPAPSGQGTPPPGQDRDLTELSLEQLMAVPVEVGARHEESFASTAASVFVLNEPEIRRSGMRSVGDLLRLVPGLIIAQDVPGAFGYSSRLGEHSFAGMLVLLDGERLYTTLLRREYFQAIDLPISNIERIEVIRGPGGARWGDRATQGVVNIVTKKAKDAQGARVAALAGTEERGSLTGRYGGTVGDDTSYYVYAKTTRRDGGWPNTSGDRWDNDRAGARIDTKFGDDVTMTVDGEYHTSLLSDSYAYDPGYISDNDIKGGHLKSRLRWDHHERGETELRLAGEAYDQDIRENDTGVFAEHLIWQEHLFSATVQHMARLGESHRLTIGAGIRHLTVDKWYWSSVSGDKYNEARSDVFASWDWDVFEHVRLTLGGNFGYLDGKDQHGTDLQPDLRIAWTPSPETTLWAGFGTNREPDRHVPDSGLVVTQKQSQLRSYEIGARRRWGDTLLLQADTFVYDLTDQESSSSTDPGSGATLYEYDGRTEAFGGELVATWNPTKQLRLTSFLATTQANAEHIGPDYTTAEKEVPNTRAGASVGWEPLPDLEVDCHVLYTEHHNAVPTWWRVDLRVGYRWSDRTSIEVVGQNLTDPHHPEYWYEEESQRGVYFQIAHRF